ncbi:hypothetical protein [Nocardia sp. NPDC057030]|uniref:hypothetical protein n=1 Tax=unclassified Nocardia TaxID=2637762 RepID=UPI00363DC4D1
MLEYPDSFRRAAIRSLAAAQAWLAANATPDCLDGDPESAAQEPNTRLLTATGLLCPDPVRWRDLDSIDASGALITEWAVVLDSLLVLAIRRYDLDALATLLRGCARLALSERPIPVRAMGFLIAQQQTDGSFGTANQNGSAERSDSIVRIALTRHCVVVLQRMCEPLDSRMRKNPSSRSPSPAMPSSVPS